jgi:uncharacterized Zn finger protein (UPF0148 family)
MRLGAVRFKARILNGRQDVALGGYTINDQSIAPHVTAEFERYTRCGILEHGFVRLYCKDCQAERVIGFSCKGRGFCPACGSRRALQKADRIEREVWPRVKARQWVLTFPHQVRAWLLRSPELFNEVISAVIDSISFLALPVNEWLASRVAGLVRLDGSKPPS